MGKATYLFISLLVVVGTQIAGSKSVSKQVVQDASGHLLVKRQVEDKAEETEAETEEVSTTTEADYTTPIAFEETTTTISPNAEEDAATVKPLGEDDSNSDNKLDSINKKEDKQVKDPKKPKPKPKPQSKPQSQPDLLNRVGEPSTNLLPPAPFTCIPPSYFGQSPPLPQFPTAFAQPQFQQQQPAAPGTHNFLLPPPLPDYLHPVVAERMGYDYSQPSGPAFSASSFASSSSSSGPNGHYSTSISSGPNGVITSHHSGPGNYGASPYNNIGPQQVVSGPFPNKVHSSGSFASASGTILPNGQPSFIGIRGSFPGDDGESVAIEVDGPAGTRISAPEGAQIIRPTAGGRPSGTPQFVGSGPNFAYTGPGFASSGSYSPGFYGDAGSNADVNAVFQQYFAQLQAQQDNFQKQIEAQIASQQQAGGTFASGGAFMTKGYGQVDPNARVYVNTFSSPNSASSATSVDSRFGFGGTKSSVSAFPYPYKYKKNSFLDQSNQIDSRFSASNEPASAFSSIALGPQGGFQQAAISPVGPGIVSRFAEDVAAPSGNAYGVFSSSSSSSSTGPDGKTISHKSATTGVNDNGRITYKTVHD